MIEVVLGALGLFVVHLSDLAAIKRLPLVKPATWIVGGITLLYVVFRSWTSPDKLILPEWATWLGWILLITAASGVVYSLFVNLPFVNTYVRRGVGDRLVTTGLYALVRHPGILLTALLVVALLMVSRSRGMLVSGPIFIALDILAVIIQDKCIFGRMFPGYVEYRRTTPMLIPSRKSMAAFLSSFGQAPERAANQ